MQRTKRIAITGSLLTLLLAACGSVQKTPTASLAAQTPGDATFRVEGEPVALSNGEALRTIAPGAASVTRSRLVGEPAYGDVDGDGDSDVALFLLQEHGGSGSFYYVVVAYRVDGGYLGANGVLLGDRIAPQSIAIKHGVILANYLERRPGEPMAAHPSVPWTACLSVVNGPRVASVKPGQVEQTTGGGLRLAYVTKGLAVQPQTEANALWLGRMVVEIAAALRDPARPDAMEKILTLGHDSRYYLMVRGWLRMQLEADMSIRQAAGEAVSPQVAERIAFVQRAIRLIDLE